MLHARETYASPDPELPAAIGPGNTEYSQCSEREEGHEVWNHRWRIFREPA